MLFDFQNILSRPRDVIIQLSFKYQIMLYAYYIGIVENISIVFFVTKCNAITSSRIQIIRQSSFSRRKLQTMKTQKLNTCIYLQEY